MKKNYTRSIRRLDLGLTQEELAILLKIPISLIAMHETNKRELPFTASMELTQMYIHHLEKQKQDLVHPILKNENAKIGSLLKEELRNNEALQWKCQKKIENMKAKYEKAKAILNLADYFEIKEAATDKPSERHAVHLLALAKSKLDGNGPVAQMKCRFQLETLKWQQQYLLEELKKAKESV